MQRLIYFIVYPLFYLVSLLPFRILYVLSDIISFLIFRIFKYRRKLVRKNLKLSGYPDKHWDLTTIEKGFYKHFCDLFLEMLKSLTLSLTTIQKRFVVLNPEVLHEFAAQKKSVFIMCGHYASYEWLLSLGLYTDHTAYGIYSPLSNPYFDRLTKHLRARYGAYLIPKKEIKKTMTEHTKSGVVGIYGFASDQSPQKRKHNYNRNFLGVKVPVFTGAERIAKQYDIPVLMASIRKVKRGYYETTLEILSSVPKENDDFSITDLFVEKLEKQIRTNPIYYLWTHNRFKHRML